jgi:hypothetical protein
MSKSDLISSILPGTLLLGFVAAAGCIMPPAQGGGGSPQYASNNQGYSGSGPSSASSEGAPPPAENASAPAAPQVVSVELHNDCDHEVKLFLGDKPKFGSGTQTSLGSNTTTSYQMKPGDMIWITDDSENGVSSTSIGGSGGMQRIRIMPGCTGFGPG